MVKKGYKRNLQLKTKNKTKQKEKKVTKRKKKRKKQKTKNMGHGIHTRVFHMFSHPSGIQESFTFFLPLRSAIFSFIIC